MFKKRDIEIHIILGTGSFNGSANTKIIKGLSCNVTINKLGAPDLNNLEATIYNMLPEDIEALTNLAFRPLQVPLNKIAVYAEGELAFSGDIVPNGAIASYTGSDTAFKIKAVTGYKASVTAISPASYQGDTDVADVVKNAAESAGYSFQNQGASKMLSNPYFQGSAVEQMTEAADMCALDLIIDDDSVILLPPTENRGGAVPLINAKSGLIGYPTYSQTGIDFKCVYRPELKIAGLVKIESVLPKATGVWKIIAIKDILSCNIPGGSWVSEVRTTYVGDMYE